MLQEQYYYRSAIEKYSRIKKLIKTILANNTSNKPVYLYLDGQQADVVGGEGIMIKQPLMENSLDD